MCKCKDDTESLDEVKRLSRFFHRDIGHSRSTDSTELVRAIQHAYFHGWTLEAVEFAMEEAKQSPQ